MKMMASSLLPPILAAVLLAVSIGSADDDVNGPHLRDDSGDRHPLHTIVPNYPERARRDRLEGEVEVCFNVDREGRTSRVAVRRSTHRIFERPSMLAVRTSTYHPLPKDQKLSGIKTCRTFRFRLTPVAIEHPDYPQQMPD